ncbi:MAG: NYN domain-containing protein [Spirochaetales bacterium]|nr:NYN domain-containing protein [Spirochaetales bacterium]
MNTAILWDIENVTPPVGTNYIQTIIDALSEHDRISYAMAFGDWNKNNIKNIASELASNSFELIHVPQSRKDSSDMSMVAHGVELIFQFPHIEKFVLITGDADFRPLLLSLRKYGKETLVICDVTRNASEDLLKMADSFWDYRDVIDNDDNSEMGDEDVQDQVMTRSQAYELLEDTIDYFQVAKKKANLGAVKIRMKLFNASFDEAKLGYKSYKSFIADAIRHTNVSYSEDIDNVLVMKNKGKIALPEVFAKLVYSLKGKGWVLFTEAAKNVDYHTYGYTRFKKLALDAEKRGLVQVQSKGLVWSLKVVEDLYL